jgi:cytidyltransferase-like protein
MKNSGKSKKPIKVFVSGCYDILHAGHIRFFEDARALGDHLTVCFASDAVLKLAKNRISSMPEDNKRYILKSLRCVDEVVMSSNLDRVFDFLDHLDKINPDIVAVTEDDSNAEKKSEFFQKRNIKLILLPKSTDNTRVSTTSILKSIKENSTR